MAAEANDWHCLSAQPPTAGGTISKTADRTIGKVTITPDNRGMAYGDGFFTTMGVIDGVILWQDYHHQRILSHAQALQLNIDSHAVLARLQLHAQQLQQGVLKLIVTRAPQAIRGYGFTENASGSPCEVWLKTTPMPIATAEQARLPDGRSVLMQPAIEAVCLSAQIACLPPALAGLKSLNRLDNVLASAELQRIKTIRSCITDENLGEGLVRDMTGHWVEGTMSNVFYQLVADQPSSLSSLTYSDDSNANYLLNGQWFTPPLSQSGVAGILRQVIIDAFASTDKPVIMRSLEHNDLPYLSKLFFCNALRGVIPVARLINDY